MTGTRRRTRRQRLAVLLAAGFLLPAATSSAGGDAARHGARQAGRSPRSDSRQAAAAAATTEAVWPQFRGPGASGVAESAVLPETFDGSNGANLAWRAEIPGLAHASPIVWGDRVFVTSAVSEAPPQRYLADVPDSRESVLDDTPHSWVLLALDRASGDLLWQRTAAEGAPRTGRHRKGSFNNSTPATDGSHIVALFGSEGLFCWDVAGNLLWQVDLGVLDAGWFFDPTVQWGTASSPVIHDGKVIVQADVFSGSFIAAFDVASGRELWRAPRDEISSWGTPTVVPAAGRAEIVTNGGRAIRAYDADTGAELWSLRPSAEIAVPTPIFAGELIFVGSGYLPTQPLYAVRAGGSGDISLAAGQREGGQVAWSVPDRGPLISTPIVVGDYLYVLSRDGTLACFDAVTGLPMYRERIVPDNGEGTPSTFSASPVAAGDNLYIAGEDGNVYVIDGGPFLRVAATNPVGEPVFATPAIADGLLLVRGLRHLYAFSR